MARPFIRMLIPLGVVLLGGAALLAQTPTPQGPQPAQPPQPPPISDQDMAQAVEAGPQGSLAIRAVQGTKGAPEVGVSEVELVLYHRDQPIWQMKSMLDEHGVVVIDKIPVAMTVRPVVRVKYSGVLYQQAGPLMDTRNREAAVEVTVYQTTDTTPAWHVAMRHIVATRADNMYNVSESVAVENPADQTWLGLPADAQGRRATVVLALPDKAADIRLESGFHGWCCTAFASHDLQIQMPLMPGKATYRFSYRVPIADGRVDLRVGSAAPMDHAMFMVPDDGSVAEATLAAAAGVEAVGPARVRVFNSSAVTPGQNAGVILAGLVTTTELATTKDSVSNAKTVAGIVAGVLLAVGLGVVVIRSRRAKGF